MDFERLTQSLIEPIRRSVISLPRTTHDALRRATLEEEEIGRTQLEAMLKAIDIGIEQKIPICQDTGTPTFYVSIGTAFPGFCEIHQLEPALRRAVQLATQVIPLRPNTVHPFNGSNPGDNTGFEIPQVIWQIHGRDTFHLTYLPKGGGCTNMSQLTMMTPGKGIRGVKDIVLTRIATMAGNPCPPTVIGVGLGGSDVMCMELAKKALLRPVGQRHPESFVAELEFELLEKANELGVGPAGIGGKTTVLDIKIEYEYRHPASFPVGIAVQCWANRQITVSVNANGSVEVIS
ncbi:fumarate hydratase [bacterium]|nr:fumarate hydratase [candidate division CSSED10-310 bacterium]